MPSNGKLLDGNVVPRLVGQAAEGWLAGRVGDFSRPQLLDDFEEGLAGWYGRWRNTRRRWAVSFLERARRWSSVVRWRYALALSMAC